MNGLPRAFLIGGFCTAVALVLGLMLATPDSYMSLAFVGLLAALLTFPLLMRWHHLLLILSWNSWIVVFFLPGQLGLWVLFAAVSLWISFMNRTLTQKATFEFVPSVAWTLLAFGLVVAFTAKMTGGIGLRSMGSENIGGKKYFLMFGAIMGYFAFVGQRIPPEKVLRYATLFFLTSLTAIISYGIYAAGPAFYFLFNIFPPEILALQELEWGGPASSGMVRLGGVATAAASLCAIMQLRYGVRGLFDLGHPWRLPAYAALVALSMIGGFRSILLSVLLTFAIQFYFERLYRTKLIVLLTAACIMVGAMALPFVEHLPLAVQRTLSFLPIEIDSAAKADAEASVEWRLEMWRTIWPEVPNYLWIGKGYSINPTDLYFANEGLRRGITKSYEPLMIAGDYHSGPLSLLVAFGVFGVLTFLAFAFASVLLLYSYYRRGNPQFQLINTFLLTYFVSKLAMFFLIYGSVANDLYIFTGIVGLSVSINGAHPKRVAAPAAESIKEDAVVAAARA